MNEPELDAAAVVDLGREVHGQVHGDEVRAEVRAADLTGLDDRVRVGGDAILAPAGVRAERRQELVHAAVFFVEDERLDRERGVREVEVHEPGRDVLVGGRDRLLGDLAEEQIQPIVGEIPVELHGVEGLAHVVEVRVPEDVLAPIQELLSAQVHRSQTPRREAEEALVQVHVVRVLDRTALSAPDSGVLQLDDGLRTFTLLRVQPHASPREQRVLERSLVCERAVVGFVARPQVGRDVELGFRHGPAARSKWQGQNHQRTTHPTSRHSPPPIQGPRSARPSPRTGRA